MLLCANFRKKLSVLLTFLLSRIRVVSNELLLLYQYHSYYLCLKKKLIMLSFYIYIVLPLVRKQLLRKRKVLLY